MNIYTSYFSHFRSIKNDDMVGVSIARVTPKNFDGVIYGKLAPSQADLARYKDTGDCDEMYLNYAMHNLYSLNPIDVIAELSALCDGKDVVLLCYEGPDKFCHRFIVMEWLNTFGNVSVKEI